MDHIFDVKLALEQAPGVDDSPENAQQVQCGGSDIQAGPQFAGRNGAVQQFAEILAERPGDIQEEAPLNFHLELIDRCGGPQAVIVLRLLARIGNLFQNAVYIR